ncbi:ABC transporter substrate-binding protein [Microbacterium sp.]|uniref:ABC transporter substrate-binding protein n=1 Tax=Microbacterium sp. TaxID=51671 RepID=UPI0039E581F4
MTPTRRLAGLGIATAALLALAACSSAPTPPTDPGNPLTAAGPVTASDLTGRSISLDAPAERVVCLDGTCIDALAELDLVPVASTQMEQVHHPLFFGPDVEVTALGGSFFEPDLEGILAAEPDLVIGSESVHGAIAASLGDVAFYGNALTSVDEAPENLRRIAVLTGREDAAEAAIERYEKTLADYRPGTRATSVLSMYGGATADIGIDAGDSTIGELLGRYTSYPWPKASESESGFLEIGLDTILDGDPAHIWILDFGFDPSAEPLVDQLAKERLWTALTAVSTGNVHLADASWWGRTGGTRGQQAILDTVLPAVYPEEFPAPLSALAG